MFNTGQLPDPQECLLQVAQVVVHLPGMHKALSSIPGTGKYNRLMKHSRVKQAVTPTLRGKGKRTMQI